MTGVALGMMLMLGLPASAVDGEQTCTVMRQWTRTQERLMATDQGGVLRQTREIRVTVESCGDGPWVLRRTREVTDWSLGESAETSATS